MKFNTLSTLLLSFLIMCFQGASATPTQPKKLDIVVVGAGPLGLGDAYELINSGIEATVFATDIGGPALKGKLPYSWQMAKSWVTHTTAKRQAQGFGCSTDDVVGESRIEDIQCLVNNLIKEIGPERLQDSYTLIEVSKSNDPKYPHELIFVDEKTKERKTVLARDLLLAIPPEDKMKIKMDETLN